MTRLKIVMCRWNFSLWLANECQEQVTLTRINIQLIINFFLIFMRDQKSSELITHSRCLSFVFIFNTNFSLNTFCVTNHHLTHNFLTSSWMCHIFFQQLALIEIFLSCCIFIIECKKVRKFSFKFWRTSYLYEIGISGFCPYRI